MGLRRGMTAVREAKNASGGGGNSNRLMISTGETVVIRLYGDFVNENDPVVAYQHYIKRLLKQAYKNCGQNTDQDCVYCYVKDHGDKGISLSQRAYFRCRDTRKVHRLDNEVKILKPGVPYVMGKPNKPEDYITTKWPPCSAPKRKCSFCAQGSQPQEQGYRYWELATKFADQLVSMQNELREFCLCGARAEDGTGTIQVNQYLCGNPDCQQPVEFYPEQGKPVATCATCRHTTAPMESISCSACDSPARAGLGDFFIKVTKNGQDQSTSYNFEAVHPCKPPTAEELAAADEKAPDFAAITAPEPVEVQARALSIPCPFAPTPGHGATTYAPPGEEEQAPKAPTFKPAPIKNMAQTARTQSARPNVANGPRPAVAPKPAPKFGAPKPAPVIQAKAKFKLPAKPQVDEEIVY